MTKWTVYYIPVNAHNHASFLCGAQFLWVRSVNCLSCCFNLKRNDLAVSFVSLKVLSTLDMQVFYILKLFISL